MLEVVQGLVESIFTWFQGAFGADSGIVKAIEAVVQAIIAGYVND